jgi:hypothetical protein
VIKNPRRAIVGIGTVFGQPSPNDGRIWKAEHFEQFLNLQIGIPVRVDHGPLITSRGVIKSVGTARRFAPITWPTDGLAVLAEIDGADGFGDDLLHDIAAVTSQTWLPHCWGLSCGACNRGCCPAVRGVGHKITCVRRREDPGCWRGRVAHLDAPDRAPNRG